MGDFFFLLAHTCKGDRSPNITIYCFWRNIWSQNGCRPTGQTVQLHINTNIDDGWICCVVQLLFIFFLFFILLSFCSYLMDHFSVTGWYWFSFLVLLRVESAWPPGSPSTHWGSPSSDCPPSHAGPLLPCRPPPRTRNTVLRYIVELQVISVSSVARTSWRTGTSQDGKWNSSSCLW